MRFILEKNGLQNSTGEKITRKQKNVHLPPICLFQQAHPESGHTTLREIVIFITVPFEERLI